MKMDGESKVTCATAQHRTRQESEMVHVMEWQKQVQRWQQQQQQQSGGENNGEMMYVKVMTDEQLETLRRQIAAYATICEQLIEMHRTLSAQHDLAGVRLGNIYCDPLMTSSVNKITSRQRWTPTPVQLQILERIFDQGIGTPNKEKIKDITVELSQHGQISETNVYNWFQNRRARSKRKLQNVAPTNTESEVDTEVDSKDKKTKPEEFQVTLSEKLCFQSPEVSSELQYLNQDSNNRPDSVFPSDGNLRPTTTINFAHMSVFDEVLSSSTSDYLAGKMQVHENYSLYQQDGDYNLAD